MDIGQSLCFDDVLMEPLLSNITSRATISLETNIGTNGRKLYLKTPLISSPMDTVTETDMAIKMALCGGLGIIHRFMTIDEQVGQVVKVKRFLQYIIKNPYRLTPDDNYCTIENLINIYNVSTFCVVDNKENNKCLGILTNRDIQMMKFKIANGASPSHLLVKDFMTPFDNTTNNTNTNLSNFHYITIFKEEQMDDLEHILLQAKEIMMEYRIEKIPLLAHNTNTLLGLITLKNIKHWADNKFKACIDATGALCVGAAIGIIDDYKERLDRLVAANVDIICIDVANGFNSNVITTIKEIRDKYPNLVIMAGNVCNSPGYLALADVDIDCIRVGVGNGSICTTRLETGIGKGQFSAVSECFRSRNRIFLYETQQVKKYTPHIICDGGSLGKTGNKVKALACGASAIMLGRTLASTEESPGQIIFRNGKRFKYIRGMASTMANISKQEKLDDKINTNTKAKKLKTNFTSEGVDGEQELTGSVAEVIEQINGGIKSGMSYLGCETIEQLHRKTQNYEIKFNVVSSIGMSETGIRVKKY